VKKACVLWLLFVLASGTIQGAEPVNAVHALADRARPAREIFVAPAGNNLKGDGSQAAPFQTINRALQGIRAGDAVRLLPGAYTNGAYIVNLSGTAEAPIWLGGVPGQPRPIFSGPSSLVLLSRIRYFVLENIEVSGGKGNGINCDDGGEFANSNATRHVLFRNLFIHDTGSGGNQDGLKLSGVNDYAVIDCEFSGISVGGSGIDHVGCHRGVIARCVFTNGGNAIQCKGGSEDIEIRANRFLNPADRAINIGGSTGFKLFRPPLSTNAPNAEAKNILVIANLFRGSLTPVAYVGAINSLVAHNTIIDPDRWLLRILQETTSKDGYTFLHCGQNQFINNLIYFDGQRISVPVNIGSNTDAASFEFAHNLWYDYQRPARSRPTLPSVEQDGIYGLDPKFKDAARGDFSMRETSPAIGKGKPLRGVRADLLNRPYRENPAIGAVEWN
jgi:hypothetical protein